MVFSQAAPEETAFKPGLLIAGGSNGIVIQAMFKGQPVAAKTHHAMRYAPRARACQLRAADPAYMLARTIAQGSRAAGP